ncbi:MAG TPA: hypothetical protein VEX41_00895, partial [Candidatus Eisenbacteria bacterium]|nr:hypothetical protein [Candidatus Eisenbacteria bacterium]
MRGRRGWERRLAERSDEPRAREESPDEEPQRRASEGTLATEAASPQPSIPPRGGAPAARGPQLTPARPDSRSTPGPGRRLPDLAALPPLLDGTAAFATLRERLGPAASPSTKKGRHAGIVAVPHGAKSYLAAALALTAGERICWVARDAEVGDRVAEELAAWLGDPGAIAVLEPRTALAYERSELIADETASRVAALAAWRAASARILVASVQALIQHTIAPEDLPERPRELRVGARLSQSALLHDLLELGYVPTLEVAGKGEFARRGGLVDVFPPSAELPARVEFFGDEIESLRAFDPTDQRSTGAVDRVTLLPASEFLLPGTGQTIRERLGKLASKAPERLLGDLARFEVPRESRADSRAIDIGDAAEVWGPFLAPAVGLDHLLAGTLLVLDEPADLAEAGEFLWRQAEERRSDLIEAGDLPGAWPSTYLPERDWATRLLASRTLELTWESEAPRAIAQGKDDLGDLFDWREPTLPLGRAARIADAVDRWRRVKHTEDGEPAEQPGRSAVAGKPPQEPPRIVIASDQAPRLAELLDEAGQVAGITNAITEPPPRGSVTLVDRSLNGGFEGGPEGLVFVTDRELFGSVRVRRPKAMRRVVPRDILERLTLGDLVVHIDHG